MTDDNSTQLVQSRIDEVLRSGSTYLNLSNMNLYEVPQSICQLTELKTLNLSKNNLETLPDYLGKFRHLQSLVLAENKFKFFPSIISNCSNLKRLYLYKNELITIPEDIGKLKNLKELSLFSNSISFLPTQIGDLQNLIDLDLELNQLTDLPKEIRNLTNLEEIDLSYNKFETLPSELWQLSNLKKLNVGGNYGFSLPNEIWQLSKLESLGVGGYRQVSFPTEIFSLSKIKSLDIYLFDSVDLPIELWNFAQLESLSFHAITNLVIPHEVQNLKNLSLLRAYSCGLEKLPQEIDQLINLTILDIPNNKLIDIPPVISALTNLQKINLDSNPLNTELNEVYQQGLEAIKTYLRAKRSSQIKLNEAKLILVGEGEVGKSSLLSALRNEPWKKNRTTTHGIEIKQVLLTNNSNNEIITLNGWDFGGQGSYRPTHQLFFSSPAVYLVVWKPREGSPQGFVKDWIKLIKYREPDAKIIVVATHGGPQQRQPDIDRQELWDIFGKETVIDFFFIDSEPNENGERLGISALKEAILETALALPEMGRLVPERWQSARSALAKTRKSFLPLENVLNICQRYKMDIDEANLFISIEHRLGHLIHYQHDPTLGNFVILKPDWLATAISFVLNDKEIRASHGLVHFSRLKEIWDDSKRPKEFRYPTELHQIFLRLMERFDFSYKVADLSSEVLSDPVSLIAQLVPDIRPDPIPNWTDYFIPGDIQQQQYCRIVDLKNNQKTTAEGLFFQLIVRLHKYSLGRDNYNDSVHWQRGLVLDNDYNGRAFIEYIDNEIRITVRAPYPERFLAMLTEEIKYLVNNFWEGLSCKVMVPCIEPCGRQIPGLGLFEVEKLIESKRKNRLDYPCPVCDEWQNIDNLLRNASISSSKIPSFSFVDNSLILSEIKSLRLSMEQHENNTAVSFQQLDNQTKLILSKIDEAYEGLLKTFSDEAKDGPRLFSIVPIDREKFNPANWISQRFRLTLWCEHSRLPLPLLNGNLDTQGVYDIDIRREWFLKAAPILKIMASTLSIVLPMASAASKMVIDNTVYSTIENQLEFSKSIIESAITGGEIISNMYDNEKSIDNINGEGQNAKGAVLRELHLFLRERDLSFGGLIRVMNKRREYLWVHPQFEKEY